MKGYFTLHRTPEQLSDAVLCHTQTGHLFFFWFFFRERRGLILFKGIQSVYAKPESQS